MFLKKVKKQISWPRKSFLLTELAAHMLQLPKLRISKRTTFRGFWYIIKDFKKEEVGINGFFIRKPNGKAAVKFHSTNYFLPWEKFSEIFKRINPSVLKQWCLMKICNSWCHLTFPPSRKNRLWHSKTFLLFLMQPESYDLTFTSCLIQVFGYVK